MKETPVKKTSWDKAKESFNTALMAAGIVFVILLLVWIPFKLMPAIFGSGSNFISTTLSSLFISGDETSNTVSNTKPATINPSNNANTNVAVQRNYYGNPDLQVTLLGTGIIDPITKQFVSSNYAGSADEIAIKFAVKNVGTNVSGAWKLRINTPSRTTPYYDSASQASIKPNDMIVYTTAFKNPINTGLNTAYITADPLNSVTEMSEANNQIIVSLNVNGTYYNYNTNYNYGYNNPTNGTSYTWTNINVDCYANPQTAYIGQSVSWFANATGGNGYYTYTWSGSDLLNANIASVSKVYYSAGVKTGYVTVTSNGQSVTKQCSVNVY